MTRAMTDESGSDNTRVLGNANWLPRKVELVPVGAGIRRADDPSVQPAGSGIRLRRSVFMEKSLEGRYHPQ
jgi:hypothetical protein